MRPSPRLAALLASALVVPTTSVVLAGPAAAATETRIVSGSTSTPWIYPYHDKTQPGPVKHRDVLGLNVEVEDLAGRSVYDGILSVEFQAQGSSAWQLISRTSGRQPYIYDWDATRARGNGTYRATFEPSDSRYAPSTTSRTVKVQRSLGDPRVARSGGNARLIGKVTPRFGKKKLVVQKRTGTKWARFTTVRTDKKGRFRARLAVPARRGAVNWFRVQIKPGDGFAKTHSTRLRVTR